MCGRLEKLEQMKLSYTYDSVTGIFYNRYNKIVTRHNKYGYISCGSVLAHRLAWFIYYGIVPDVIDHINGVKTDNRISNLRNVTQHKNTFNTNAKGFRKRDSGRYSAEIMLSRRKISLGTFDTEQEAHQAYLDAKKIYHII